MMVTMRLTSQSEPGPEPKPVAGDDLDAGVTGLLRYRRLVIRVLLVIFLLLPVVGLLRSHHHNAGAHPGFLIPATLVFVVLIDRTVLVRMPEPGRYARWQWALLPLVVALGNLLAHSAERRNFLMYRLKETRAELARAAVADERLRISRDLHDLLGHSLSLITLKAELAGRVIRTDPERAAREIAELETVARRSLTPRCARR